MGLRYRGPDGSGSGERDLRLDWIRGYAVLAMSLNHFGLDKSAFHFFTGRSVFLINAAEVFFFVSGLTLGLISLRRPIAEAMGRCYRRAVEIMLWVLVLALGGVALEGGEVESMAAFVGTVLTLQEAPFWGDVLVAYIGFLIVTPMVLHALHKGRTTLVLLVIGGVYAMSQIDPAGLMLPIASFRNLAANAPLFLGAVVLGWHRKEVAASWRRFPGRVAADGLIVAAGLVMLVLYATDYRSWPAAGEVLGTYGLGEREYHMPLGALLVVGVYLRCIFLLVDHLWAALKVGLGWLMLPLGRAALFAYVMHAFMMTAAWMLLDLVGWGADLDLMLNATIICAVYAGLIYGAVWARTGVLALLRREGAGAWVRRAALRGGLPATVALGALALGTLGPIGGFQGYEDDGEDAWLWAVHDGLYSEMEGFDTERGAVVLTHLWTEPGWREAKREKGEGDQIAEAVWELGWHLNEIAEAELGADRFEAGGVRVLPVLDAGAFGIEAETLGAPFEEAGSRMRVVEDGARRADVLLVVVSLEGDWHEILERVEDAVEGARSKREDLLVVISTAGWPGDELRESWEELVEEGWGEEDDEDWDDEDEEENEGDEDEDEERWT